MNTLLIFALLILPACASMSSNGEYRNSDEYQNRAVLTDAVSVTDGQSLSQDDIQRLLKSKVDLRRTLKVAFVKGADTVSSSRWQPRTQGLTMTPELSTALKEVTRESKYIKDISFIPQFMMPKEFSIKNVRDVAAVMQADVVVILFTKTESDSKVRLLSPNKAKSVVTLEAMMVDVRTGAVPFTTIATGTAQLEKDKSEDFSEAEFHQRTVITAENKAIGELAKNLVEYLN